jgi:hypothetical protein
MGCSGPGCSQQEQAVGGEGRPGGPAGRAEAGQQRRPERPGCAQLTQHCTQHGTAASSTLPDAPSCAAPPRSCRSPSPVVMVFTTLQAMALRVAMTHACVMDKPKLQAAPTRCCTVMAICLSMLYSHGNLPVHVASPRQRYQMQAWQS